MENEVWLQVGWLWIPLAWLAGASLVLLVAMSRAFPPLRWLAAAFLLAPLALIACFFPRRWLVPLGLAQPEPRPTGPALKIPPEKLLSGKALRGEILELRRARRLREAAELLEVLLDVSEETAQRLQEEVPSWYYDEASRVYRALGDARSEKKVLTRFLARTGGGHPKVAQRFEKRLAEL